nr:hypothetical protein [uncultured Niameybacter sp.]
MRKIKYISFIALIMTVSLLSYISSKVSQEEKDQYIINEDNEYKTNIIKDSTTWVKDFNIEDIDLAINHIDYLLSNNNNSFDTYIPKGTSRTKDYLKEVRSMLLVDNKYTEVTFFIALVTVDIDGETYLAPFESRILAATPKNGEKIYLF